MAEQPVRQQVTIWMNNLHPDTTLPHFRFKRSNIRRFIFPLVAESQRTMEILVYIITLGCVFLRLSSFYGSR